jgi:hypothetical protein
MRNRSVKKYLLDFKDDIKLALKNCNPKFQAIILLMSSSGMGSAEVSSLSHKQLLESLQEYINFPKNSMVSA